MVTVISPFKLVISFPIISSIICSACFVFYLGRACQETCNVHLMAVDVIIIISIISFRELYHELFFSAPTTIQKQYSFQM